MIPIILTIGPSYYCSQGKVKNVKESHTVTPTIAFIYYFQTFKNQTMYHHQPKTMDPNP